MRNYWRVTIWAVLLLAALWFLYQVRSILPPFIAAWLIGILMEPTIVKLRASGYSRLRAVGLVYLLVFLVLTLSALLLGPPAVRQLGELEKQMPKYVASLQSTLSDAIPDDAWLKKNEKTLRAVGLEPSREAIFEKVVKPRLDDAQSYAVALGQSFLSKLSQVAGWIFQLALIPILTFVVMIDYDNLRRRAIGLIPMSIRPSTLELLDDIGDVFTNYLRSLLLCVSLYSVVAAGLFALLGLPSPLLLGFVTGLLTIAPYVGPALNLTLLTIVLLANPHEGLSPYLAIGGTGVHFAGTLILYVLFDQSWNSLVVPRIAGTAVGLNLFMSFFSIACGGVLFGLVGVIVAFPVAGSIKVVLERILKHVVEDRPKRRVRLPRVPLRFRVRSQLGTGTP
ncbi:MAG: AI-2E family transporter [Fimbriimonadia bacterium]|jgi:predicted PurR-regulated permease PerM